MGWTFHGKKRAVDAEWHLKRLHKTTPFIESPLTGADQENLVFSQRHEANSVELFFDLFFVANLATFTAYHTISDADYLLAYIGFFGILWATWFQITLHDVRFARDSIYERICKTLQFIAFVGLALVGSSFNPTAKKTKDDPTAMKANNKNFEILCYVLVISRGVLAIQYMVVLFYTWRAKYSKLYLPLGLMIGTYVTATGIFGGMIPFYIPNSKPPQQLYMIWYGVMIAEAIVIITISCCWRMLSFKKTHLMERMSLLTIIVIGEGAIGVTKTIGRIMSKGLDVEGCFLIMCIIVILVFIWALYFDNFPHGHYGTIRQQIWSLLHFPFQLAVVGVVEGAQQIAMARYVLKTVETGTKKLHAICVDKNLDGPALRDALFHFAEYYSFDKKLYTYAYYFDVRDHIEAIGNATGICSTTNATTYTSTGDFPPDFLSIENALQNGVYAGLGVQVRLDKALDTSSRLHIAEKSWWLTYMYFWSCFCLLIVSLIVFLVLIRRHRIDAFDIASIIIRILVLGAGGAALGALADREKLVAILNSPAILPLAVVLMFIVLCADKIAAVWSNARLVRSGEPYALEVEDEHHGHGHGHGNSHGEVVHLADMPTGDGEYMQLHHAPIHRGRPDYLKKTHRVSKGWSSQSDINNRDSREDERVETAYNPHHYRNSSLITAETLVSEQPLRSPSPDAGGNEPGGRYYSQMEGGNVGKGGYAPVAQ